MQRVLVDADNKPIQNPLSADDAEALNDTDQRKYIPWRILSRDPPRGEEGKILVQWKGYPRSDATWEPKKIEDKIKAADADGA